jgi:hypothetical protein
MEDPMLKTLRSRFIGMVVAATLLTVSGCAGPWEPAVRYPGDVQLAGPGVGSGRVDDQGAEYGIAMQSAVDSIRAALH